MGNSGPAKLLRPLDNVETRFASVNQIDLMKADKSIHRLDKPTLPTLFIHYTSEPPTNINQSQKYNTVFLSDAVSTKTFTQINEKYPKSYVKINLNGQNTHPLIKYLKKNCSSLYDYQGVGAHKINEAIGYFLLNTNGIVKYFPQSKLEELNTEISSL